MTTVKYIGIVINTIYILMVLLFILDVSSVLETKGESLKAFIHFGSLYGFLIIVPYNLFIYKSKIWNVAVCIVSLSMVLCFSMVVYKRGILGYLFSTESWNTQTVLYENGHLGFKKIEFQMQDVGALGYNERYVSVTYLSKWFMITNEIDPNKTFGAEWIKVDKNVNELDIVY